MKLITGKTQFQLGAESAVAIGKFDGIHRGHKRLLEEILSCREQGMLAVVFTFDPPASSFFAGRDLPELTTKTEKRRFFAAMGVDVLIEFPLNRETAAILPQQFIEEVLVRQMGMRFIAAGTDLSFGAGGAGDAAFLQSMAEKAGYRVQIIEKICDEGREISSTCLREVVKQGRMEQAARLLGEPYRIIGEVVHGKQLGRTIGMPTVNQLPEPQKLLPPKGVYYSRVRFGTEVWNGITNIGCKPTVSSEQVMGVETYLYDFSGDMYGCELEVSLLHYKRPELRFDGLEALKAQMQQDIAQGRAYFREFEQKKR